MLTKIEAVNARGDILSLPLSDFSSGFVVKDVDGLGPVKATISKSSFALGDGVKIQGAKTGERNVVITLGLVGQDVQALRNTLYSYFIPEAIVTLRLWQDNALFATTYGIVESCASAMFSRDPSMIISILCERSFLTAPISEVVSGQTVTDTSEIGVNYQGTVSTGVSLNLNVSQSISGVMAYNRAPDGAFYAMEFSGALLAGDVLNIKSVFRDKSATLMRSGFQTNVLYGLSPASAWLQLYPGMNHLRVVASGEPMTYTITYQEKYGGI